MMSPFELLAILALCGYAVYKQSQAQQVTEKGRFKLAIIYAAVGLGIGGFAAPHGAAAVGLLAVSVGLSLVVGLARGLLTPLRLDAAGRVWRRGSAVTIGLFLGMIAVKFALGTLAYAEQVHDGAGLGEILVMLAVMMAVQAQIVWRRAQTLTTDTQPAMATR